MDNSRTTFEYINRFQYTPRMEAALTALIIFTAITIGWIAGLCISHL